MADVEKRVVALETEVANLKKSYASNLESLKKAINSFTKDMRDTETHYQEESKELHKSFAALTKQVEECEKRVGKVIETQGGGI
jgi:phage host-nuclease inhibitor protein Gam